MKPHHNAMQQSKRASESVVRAMSLIRWIVGGVYPISPDKSARLI